MSSQTALNKNAQNLPLFAMYADRLTRSDLQIANYIADHYSNLVSMTISELSAAIGVSEITVSRFCKKLDKSGLQALKIALAGNVGTTPDLSAACILESDDTLTVAQKIFKSVTQGLENTLKILDTHAIDNSARLIAQCSRLLVYGFGAAGALGKDIQIRFIRFGKSVEYATDPHQQAMLSSLLNPEAVIFAVSTSGSSVDLVKSLTIARDRGAKIVLLTTHKKSPCASLADEIILATAPEVESNAEISVLRMVYLAVMDVLYAKLALYDKENYSANITGLRQALADLKS